MAGDSLTVAEAAEVLGVSAKTVHRLIREGRLKYRQYRKRGRYVLDRGEVVKLRAGTPTPPKTKKIVLTKHVKMKSRKGPEDYTSALRNRHGL